MIPSLRTLLSLRLTLACALVAAVLAGLAPQFVDTFSLLQATVFVAMAVLALSLGFIWGLRRHPVLRPGGLLRARRLRLCGGGLQLRRQHGPADPVDAGPDALRRPARLLHVLRAHLQRLRGRHHPHGDADPVQRRQLHRRGRLSHRRRGARRLQRHPLGPRHHPADHRLFLRARGRLVPRGGLPHPGLRRAEAAARRSLRPRRGGDPRERDAGGAARLRPAALQAPRLRHRGRHRGPRRLPLHALGRLHQPDDLRPRHLGPDHHLGDDRRPRHADRPRCWAPWRSSIS